MIERLCVLRLEAASADAMRRAVAADASFRRRACEALQARLAPLKVEAMLLATCERVEVPLLRAHDLSASEGPTLDAAASAVPEALGALLGSPIAIADAWQGIAALERLFRLAAGLESRIVGEDHIRRQMIDALALARTSGLCGAQLGRLADRALHAGRRVRAAGGLVGSGGRLGGSYADATIRLVQAAVAAHAAASRAMVTILGTGMIARDIVDGLAANERCAIAVLSRHRERAEAAFAGRPIRFLNWADGRGVHDALAASDVLIAATTSAQPIVVASQHGDRRVAPLLIDLGAPPLIDPALAERTRLVTLSELGHAEVERRAIEEAESMLASSLARLVERVAPTATLVAVHGAGDGSDANRRAEELGDRLRATRPARAVGVGFRRGTPGFSDACATIATRAATVTVIPLMTSAGYFAREVLPAALAAPAKVARATVRITAPVGTLVAPRIAIAELAIARTDMGDIGRVIVVGHGTERSATSGASARALAAMIRRELVRRSKPLPVETAFLDQAPRIDLVCARRSPDGRRTLLVPFLWGGGGHERQDLFEELLAGDPSLVAIESFGRSDAVAAAVDALDRAYAPGRTLRLGTRGSRLALRQAEIAACALRAAGHAVRIVTMSTAGDRDLERPIETFEMEGPFTDDLERALAEDRCDIAVHSLKDLPLAVAVGAHAEGFALTRIAGVLPRASAAESLVTFDGRPLEGLPRGARVGTSSVRRTAQLLALRPDLRPVGIRGAVDARIEQVRDGRFEAAVLAEAGVRRLGATDAIAERWPIATFVPEAAQGAIALTARSDDEPACAACAMVNDRATHDAVRIERQIARAIEGGALHATGRRFVVAVHCGFAAGEPLRVRAIDRASGAMRDMIVERPAGTVDDVVAARVVRTALWGARQAWLREVVA